MATKKKQAKTRRKSTARSAAKARAKKAKPGAKKKAAAKKKPAKKAKKAAAKKVAAKRAAPSRKPAPKARAAKKPAAKTAVRAAAAKKPAPVAAPPEHDLRDEIEVTLYRRGIDSVPALVDVLAAVARGYKSGPATPPPGVVIDVNTPLADALVARYETGNREPDRRSHRPQVLATVGFNLDQLGLADTSEDARQVLTTLCLGSWDPGTGTHAQLDGAASFVVRFYRDGL